MKSLEQPSDAPLPLVSDVAVTESTPVAYSVAPSHGAPVEAVRGTWAELLRRCALHVVPPKSTASEDIKAAKAGSCIVAAEFAESPCARHLELVALRTMLPIDLDSLTAESWSAVERRLGELGLAYLRYPSYQWTVERPRWRVLVALDRPVTVDVDFGAATRAVLPEGVPFDARVSDGPNQALYLHRAPTAAGRPSEVFIRGRALRTDALPRLDAVSRPGPDACMPREAAPASADVSEAAWAHVCNYARQQPALPTDPAKWGDSGRAAHEAAKARAESKGETYVQRSGHPDSIAVASILAQWALPYEDALRMMARHTAEHVHVETRRTAAENESALRWAYESADDWGVKRKAHEDNQRMLATMAECLATSQRLARERGVLAGAQVLGPTMRRETVASTTPPAEAAERLASYEEVLRAQLTPQEWRQYQAVQARPWDPNIYPKETVTDILGYGLVAAMLQGGWSILRGSGGQLQAVQTSPEYLREVRAQADELAQATGHSPDPVPAYQAMPLFALAKWIPTVTGGPKSKPQRITTMWETHAHRYTKVDMAINPAHLPPGTLNVWGGLAVAPRPGDTDLWSEALELVTAGECTDYLERWCAWKLQHPLDVPDSVILLTGDEGTGKSTIGKVMAGFFGMHGANFTSPSFLSRFNAILAGKCFVSVDETRVLTDDQLATLRSLVTSEHITLEAKGIDPVETRNHAAYVLCGNEDILHRMSGEGRRYVCYSTDQHRPLTWWRAWYDWLHHGGREAIAYRLLTMDLGGWTPRERPETRALQEARMSGLRGIDAWLSHVHAAGGWEDAPPGEATRAPNSGLLALDERLYSGRWATAQGVHTAYLRWCDENRVSERMHISTAGKALRGWGFERRHTERGWSWLLSNDVLQSGIDQIAKKGKRKI